MYTLDYLPFVQKNEEEPTAVYKCTAILLSDSSRQKQLDVQTQKGGSSLFFPLQTRTPTDAVIARPSETIS